MGNINATNLFPQKKSQLLFIIIYAMISFTGCGKKMAGFSGTSNKILSPSNRVPNSKPSFEIENPISGSYVRFDNQNTFAVSGTCSKTGSSIHFSIDNNPLTSSTSCINGTWSTSLNLSTISEGPHTLSALQKNTDGKANEESQINLNKDTIPPSVSITTILNGSFAGGSLTNLTWNYSDLNAPAFPINLEYSPDNGQSWLPIVSNISNVGFYLWSFPLINSTTVFFRIVAKDLAENIVIKTSSVFSINSTAPEKPKIVLTTPLEDSSTSLSFQNLSCNDQTKIIVRENSTPPQISDLDWISCSINSNAITYNLTNSNMGYRPLYAWAQDEVGHISSMKTIPFTYAPRLVLGTDTPESISANLGGLENPRKIISVGNKLIAVDTCRVLIWNSLPTVNRQAQDLTLGTPKNDLKLCNYNGVSKTSLNTPWSVSSDGTVLAVADTGNHRVLIYQQIPTQTNTPADIVLGQPDFNSSTPNFEGVSARTMNNPYGVLVHGNKLYVADGDNHRILIWNSIPTTSNQPADIVLGQPSFTTNTFNNGGRSAQTLYYPYDLIIVSNKLYVSDRSNHRILIWNTLPNVNQAPADLVLGQNSMTSGTANLGGVANAGTLYSPFYLFSDGVRLFAADTSNHRVLIWNTLPNSNQAPADVVVGQPTFLANSLNQGGSPNAATLSNPRSATVDSTGQLWISDLGNNRILRFPSIPTTNGASADLVLGQSILNNMKGSYSPGLAANVYNGPKRLRIYQQKLYVADYFNSRILRYDSIPTTNNTLPTEVFGQPDFISMSSNQNQASPGQNTLNAPLDFLFGGNQLYIGDNNNSRILGWSHYTGSLSTLPDFVLGQPDFVSSTANNGGLSSSSVSGGARMGSDGTRFAASNGPNNRVLIWNSLPSSTQQTADIVLGQPDMISNAVNNGGISARTLNIPKDVVFYNGKIIVADYQNHRVLIWNQVPTSNFQAADVVIGQSDFISNQANAFGQHSLASLYLPISVIVLPDGKLVIHSYGQATRVWNQIPTTNGAEADRIFGGYSPYYDFFPNNPSLGLWGLSSFGGLEFDGTRIMAADDKANRGLFFSLPDVSLTSGWLSASPNVNLTIHDCYNYTKVLVNEGSQPSTNDPGWQNCSTSKNSLSYTTNSTEGYHLLKVWFKDDDGLVLNQYRSLDFALDQTGPEKPSIIPSGTVTSSPLISGAAATCNDVSEILVSESSIPPNSNSTGWQTCSTSSMTYTLTNLTEGNRTIYIWARDASGNISITPTQVNLIYDITPPSISPVATITREYIGTFTTIFLTMNNCTDAAAIFVNEGSRPNSSDSGWTTCNTTSNLISYNVSYPTTGTHTIKVWSKDAAGNVSVSPYSITKTYDALRVLGQNNFSQIFSAQLGFSRPGGISSDGTRLALADTENGRVLLWNTIPTSTNTPADVVLGQPDPWTVGKSSLINSTTQTPSASNIGYSYDVLLVSGKLIASDFMNRRVLIWNSIPTTNAQPADIVLGQASFTTDTAGVSSSQLTSPLGIASDGTRLAVADNTRHRVLIWNTFPTSNQTPADVVLGQPTFSSSTANNGGVSAQSLKNPWGVRISNGKLYIADNGNNRVLVWNSIPTTNQAPADWVLGQPDFSTVTAGVSATKLDGPKYIEVIGSQIYVTDYNNHRTMVWDQYPTAQGMAVSRVIGQPNFTSNSYSCSSGGEYYPNGVTKQGSSLWIVSYGCGTLRKWNSVPATDGQSEDFNVGSGVVASVANPIQTLDATTLYLPSSIATSADGKLYIASANSNRILGWNYLPTSHNAPADFVLGQNSFTSTSTRNPAVTSAGYLYRPREIRANSGKFLIADSGNNRIMIYQTLPNTTGQTADLFLGQADSSGVSANRGSTPNSNTLNSPYSSYYDGTRLFVADTLNNRVLIWNSFPTSSGQSANVVLGQPDFTSNTANSGGVSASSLNSPQSVYSDGTQLFVTDTNNHRILRWQTIPTSNGAAADLVIGQINLNSNNNSTNISSCS